MMKLRRMVWNGMDIEIEIDRNREKVELESVPDHVFLESSHNHI